MPSAMRRKGKAGVHIQGIPVATPGGAGILRWMPCSRESAVPTLSPQLPRGPFKTPETSGAFQHLKAPSLL
jgi:hypothetical protein